MLRLRLTNDAQPRWRLGQPPHSTAGVASANSSHCSMSMETNSGIACGRRSVTIAMMNTGKASAALVQKRRVMSFNSVLSSDVALRGSRAMPQIGQLPGSLRTTSGCIGQVYSTAPGADGDSVSSVTPHFGQVPGAGWGISGCIGGGD